MKTVKIRKKPDNLTEEEIAVKNSKTLNELEEQAIKAVHSAINGIKNSRKLRDDIRTGKKELIISTHDGRLIVKDDYCTYICNGREKKYRKGVQGQVILEHLVKARTNSNNYKLGSERLRGILINEWSLSADRGVNSRTVAAARDKINKFFGISLIESDDNGTYWIGEHFKK